MRSSVRRIEPCGTHGPPNSLLQTTVGHQNDKVALLIDQVMTCRRWATECGWPVRGTPPSWRDVSKMKCGSYRHTEPHVWLREHMCICIDGSGCVSLPIPPPPRPTRAPPRARHTHSALRPVQPAPEAGPSSLSWTDAEAAAACGQQLVHNACCWPISRPPAPRFSGAQQPASPRHASRQGGKPSACPAPWGPCAEAAARHAPEGGCGPAAGEEDPPAAAPRAAAGGL